MKFFFPIPLALACLLVTFEGVVAAQDAGAEAPELTGEMRPRVTASIHPRNNLMTGDVTTLTIDVDARQGDDVTIPSQRFGPCEMHRRHARIDEPRNGRQRSVFTIELLCLEPGRGVIPPTRVRVVTKENVIGEVRTQPTPLQIGSLLANEPNAQPKPATQPVPVFEKNYTLIYAAYALAAIIAIVLLTLLVSAWWKRRAKPVPPPPPPRPPWDVAREKLAQLHSAAPRMFAEGEAEKWVDGVSDTLREYLGARYDFVGLESTTDEITQYLNKAPLHGVSVQEIAAVLGDCDLVKFARATPDEQWAVGLINAAYRVVAVTTPMLGPSSARPSSGRPPSAGGGR